MRNPMPRRSRGFTLIEMIAAFVIFSIAVGALMQILTMSMNNARYSADETRAALWAQSLLDNVGVGERVEAGSSSGEFDRKFRWQLEIEQIDPELVVAEVVQPAAEGGIAPQPVPPAAGLAPGFDVPQIDLFHVELTVLWGDASRERMARFTTLRTANPDPLESRSGSGPGVMGLQRRDPGMDRNRGRGAERGNRR